MSKITLYEKLCASKENMIDWALSWRCFECLYDPVCEEEQRERCRQGVIKELDREVEEDNNCELL